MSALLEVRNLHVHFPLGGGIARLVGGGGTIEAVSGVGFDLGRGETLALVGESGSGKTTLARAVAGLGGDVTGTVLFDGRSILGRTGEARQALRREIAFIQQDAVSSLSPRFTVERLLKEPFRIHRIPCPHGEVERLLGLVGLPASFASRHPHELSGGQARRVGVARAIALGPRLVIADEPTAGLDVSVQGEVLNLLNDLRETLGLALLIITHNLNVVRHVADRMAIMYLGRFVETGSTEQVFPDPRHPYTAALLSANPVIDASARVGRIKLEGEVPSLLHRPSGCEFHLRCPFARPDCAEVPPPPVREGSRSFTCRYPIDLLTEGARFG